VQTAATAATAAMVALLVTVAPIVLHTELLAGLPSELSRVPLARLRTALSAGLLVGLPVGPATRRPRLAPVLRDGIATDLLTGPPAGSASRLVRVPSARLRTVRRTVLRARPPAGSAIGLFVGLLARVLTGLPATGLLGVLVGETLWVRVVGGRGWWLVLGFGLLGGWWGCWRWLWWRWCS
jgi:hypothetical protein